MPSGGRPPHHWKTTTFVAGLRSHGIAAPFVLDGPINRIAFETYVDKVLVPELRPGDIVIMDNFSSHKGPRVREMIEAAGASLFFLPPYSPDFNPIENAFSKLKAHLRKAAERTVDGLWNAIGRVIVAKTFEKHPAMEPHERPSMYRPTIRGMTNEAEIREGRMPTLRQMVRIAMTTGVRKGLSAYTPYQWQMPLLYAAAHVGELCYARGETTLDTSVGAAGLFAVVLNEEFSLGGRDTHWNVDEEMSECSRGIYDAILPAQREARLEFGNVAHEAVFKKTPVLLKVDDFSQKFVVPLKFPTSPTGE